METLLDKCDRINALLSVTLGPVEQLGLRATDWVEWTFGGTVVTFHQLRC